MNEFTLMPSGLSLFIVFLFYFSFISNFLLVNCHGNIKLPLLSTYEEISLQRSHLLLGARYGNGLLTLFKSHK
jgi:hypothetical protein